MVDESIRPTPLADWRLTQLEQSIQSVLTKLDTIILNYPTKETLNLVLQPVLDEMNNLKERHAEMEREFEKYKTRKEDYGNQFKIAIFAAVASPVCMVVLSAVTIISK